MGLRSTLTSAGSRLVATTENALEVARFGGLRTDDEPSPSIIVAEDHRSRLLRYLTEAPEGDTGTPVVLVPPLMMTAGVWDVSESTSAVRVLRAAGQDPWVVDFGDPERLEGGLERTLADHVLAVSDAVDRVRDATGREVHLAGYSQGGMFCYQAAAYRRSRDVASVIAFGSPVDARRPLPLGMPNEAVQRVIGAAAQRLPVPYVPGWMSRTGFRMVDPVNAVRQQLDFVLALHDREALLPRERQRQFLNSEGFIAYPGPALLDLMRQFVMHNRMLTGGMVIGDHLVTLADLTCPVLVFTGTVDTFAPPAGVRAVVEAAPLATVYEKEMQTGHFGLVVGSRASGTTWPTVSGWLEHLETGAALPEGVALCKGDTGEPSKPADVVARLGQGLWLAAGAGAGAARTVQHAAEDTIEAARSIGGEAIVAIPRLARLEQIRPGTRISMGALLDEQARRARDNVFFLYEDRAHTNAAAKHRIDSVVRGLLSIGVRQGEHVGVLMGTRPSAVTVAAALNRVGAVAVLMRPGGDVGVEVELGAATRIVADPEHAEAALGSGLEVAVLGGGAEPRELGLPVVDLERIDPDDVEVPRWYKANPGRARDLAFIVFTGEGDRTRTNRITNRRWALSAVGTASAASLSDSDTVYVVAPIHHPSALLMGVGGAIAGGSRIAMASGFDPETFWEEVRRYGVTVASYTWTMLRDLVNAPPNPAERNHPVRLFAGSGMPSGLWRRVVSRFAPARVLEFYTSSAGEAILVNVAGTRPRAGGRALPGSPEVRVAEWDLDANRLVVGEDGFGRRCDPGEIGMLLVRSQPGADMPGEPPLRGVFERDDAWVATGDLFVPEADGTFWLVDSAAALVHTKDGPVAPARARAALESIDAVDLAVAYGVPSRNGGDAKLVAAVTLRDGRDLDRREAARALAELPAEQRPVAIRVTGEIPTTTWHRPRVEHLRTAALKADGDRLLRADRKRESYAERAK